MLRSRLRVLRVSWDSIPAWIPIRPREKCPLRLWALWRSPTARWSLLRLLVARLPWWGGFEPDPNPMAARRRKGSGVVAGAGVAPIGAVGIAAADDENRQRIGERCCASGNMNSRERTKTGSSPAGRATSRRRTRPSLRASARTPPWSVGTPSPPAIRGVRAPRLQECRIAAAQVPYLPLQ